MVQAQIRYLHEIGGQLYYRRRVPDDLKPILGRSEWKHALGLSRGQEHHAARITAEYDVAYARLIARERISRLEGPASPMAFGSPSSGPGAMASAPAQPQRTKVPKITLSEAYAYDLETYGGSRDEKVPQVAVASVKDLIGDPDILSMTPKDVQGWIAACQAKGQKATTIRRRINALHAILARYYRDHELEKKNPFSNTRISGGTSSKADRLPFHTSHLKRIDRYFSGSDRLKAETTEIITLLKLTGARPLEIGGLDAADVLLDHEVPHIWIRGNRHRRIKTKGSERRIPLVDAALEAARSAKLRMPSGAVFSKGCHNTNSLSQRLNKLIRRAGVPKSTRLVV
ncbi:MAG: DUF6538 domain-containing protein [Pseudomonadota bacterium]